MKVHTTNYQNTFIAVADDCPAVAGEVPPQKGDKRSVANIAFELVANHPYQFTSDEVLFQIHAERNDLTPDELEDARQHFFSKGQACFRASPLTKRYGWGVHFDADGRMAIYGRGTPEYERFLEDSRLQALKAMRSSR